MLPLARQKIMRTGDTAQAHGWKESTHKLLFLMTQCVDKNTCEYMLEASVVSFNDSLKALTQAVSFGNGDMAMAVLLGRLLLQLRSTHQRLSYLNHESLGIKKLYLYFYLYYRYDKKMPPHVDLWQKNWRHTQASGNCWRSHCDSPVDDHFHHWLCNLLGVNHPFSDKPKSIISSSSSIHYSLLKSRILIPIKKKRWVNNVNSP